MKIKRYTAESMRAALALVRSEQGADAVILSSRRGEDGIEVITAVDYDEALFMDMSRQRASMPDGRPPEAAAPAASRGLVEPVETRTEEKRALAAATAQRGARAVPAGAQPAVSPPTASRPAAPRPAPAPPATGNRPPAAAPVIRADPGVQAMQRQLDALQHMLQSGLADMSWSNRCAREPLRARILEDLSALDIAPDVALRLANQAPRRTTAEDPSQIPLALLVKHLATVEDLSGLSSGIIAVVGPTGAGKTTTIAKLAARFCMRHGNRDLALVSTDGYRIGARDQLLTYARIFDAPMHAATSGLDLARTLSRLADKKLILIDTAGMGPRDVRLGEQLAALDLGAARAKVLLALPAQGEAHALDEIVRAYARTRPVGCVLTKVDEAASLGAVISAIIRHGLQIAYFCNGQRVPDDLHSAHRRRVWLARMALALKEGRPRERTCAYFARNFGEHPPMPELRLSAAQLDALAELNSSRPVKVIAVTGGKGGVGKTTVSANLAVSIAAQGREVMLVDADLGLANVDVILGVHTRFHLGHVIGGECALEDAIVTGPHGLQIVPAASGLKRMANLTPAEHAGIIRAFSDLYHRIEVLVIDTAAGLHDSVTTFTQAAHHVLVVICDEPASITDAYALIKVLSREHGVRRFQILANQTRRSGEGPDLYQKIARVCDRFLNVSLEFAGSIPFDNYLRRAVQRQAPVVDAYPASISSIALKNLAAKADKWSMPQGARGHLEFFVERMVGARMGPSTVLQ